MEYLAGGTVADAIRVGAVEAPGGGALDPRGGLGARSRPRARDRAPRHQAGQLPAQPQPRPARRRLRDRPAGLEDTITSTGELFGTAAYLSPEQALGREATGASDRYALTVAAFELLAGERPFDAPHFAAQARQHIEDDRPRACDRDRTLPPAVDEVLMRGMAKEPDERFETAGDFVDALETALSGGIAVTAAGDDQRRRARTAGHFVGAGASAATATPARNGNGRSASAARGPRHLAPAHPATLSAARRARLGPRAAIVQADPRAPAHAAGCSPSSRCWWRSAASARWRWRGSAAPAPGPATPRRPAASRRPHAPAATQDQARRRGPRAGAVLDLHHAGHPRPAERRAAPAHRSQRAARGQLPGGDRHAAQGGLDRRPQQHHLRLRPL